MLRSGLGFRLGFGSESGLGVLGLGLGLGLGFGLGFGLGLGLVSGLEQLFWSVDPGIELKLIVFVTSRRYRQTNSAQELKETTGSNH